MTYRKIETGDRHVECPVPEPEPRLSWVPISRLVVDEEYQRPLGRANWTAIMKIAANFQWHRFTPMLIAPVPDEDLFCVIDGQHRAHAALVAGKSSVPAMIVDLDTKGQASAFSWVNGQVTAITAFHIYKAGLAAGDPEAIAARDAVEAAGAKLMTYTASTNVKKPGQIYAIGLVRRWIKRGQGDLVTSGIRALARSQFSDERDYWSNAVLDPLFNAMNAVPEVIPLDLAPFLNAHDPLALRRKITRLIETPDYHGQRRPALMNASMTGYLRAWVKDQRGVS